MKPFLRTALITVALVAPAALPAFQDHDRNQKSDQKSNQRSEQSKRYFDQQGKDWHDWNDSENQAYSRYAQEHKGYNRDFNRLFKKQQQSYFDWRHQHMDDHHTEDRR